MGRPVRRRARRHRRDRGAGRDQPGQGRGHGPRRPVRRAVLLRPAGLPRDPLDGHDPLQQHAQLLRRQQRHRDRAVEIPRDRFAGGDHAARVLDHDRRASEGRSDARCASARCSPPRCWSAPAAAAARRRPPTPTPTPTPTAAITAYNVENCFTQAIPGTGGQTLRALIIPDTLRLDLTRPSGFPNGRDLDDPVIDITLAALFLDFTVTGQSPRRSPTCRSIRRRNDRPFSTTSRSSLRRRARRRSPRPPGPASISAPIADSAYVQVDRMGMPAVATALIGSSHEDPYNDASPPADIAGQFRAEETALLTNCSTPSATTARRSASRSARARHDRAAAVPARPGGAPGAGSRRPRWRCWR